MEQFRQIGEVVGSLEALMVFQDNLLNQRQCCLLANMLNSGYKTIAQKMKKNLKFEEKNTKWKLIEHPLKELLRVFKEGETYIKQCLETKDWWAKAILLYQNDCIEFHIHNLLIYISIAIEAIELAGQISGDDPDDIQRKHLYSMKYQKDFKDPRTFQWVFGDQYLVSQDFCSQIESAWEDDRWFLLKQIRHMKNSGCLASKRKLGLADLHLKYLDPSGGNDDVLLPSSILVNAKDYALRRRVGSGNQYKEIQWLGESFALRHLHGEIEPLVPEIRKELKLCHPNILQTLCAFADEEKKECFLVMELMSRDLSSYIKEACGARKRIVPFSLPVAVDLMLQIARGMEYLHSKGIYHGELNPSNIFIKSRSAGGEGYLHAKVSGFGISSCHSSGTTKAPTNQNDQLPFIWYAPEVLADQEQVGDASYSKNSEKSDVYSFGMVFFEVLTGKVPFEDAHLQGDKMSRNVRAGERPLFPFHSPKYLTNLTKKCWHNDPNQRPTFSSICRILRYAKRFLVTNPESNQPDCPMPPIDFQEIEAGIIKSFPSMENSKLLSTTQIPFQMFVYRVTEREKANAGHHHREISESGSEGSLCGDENAVTAEVPLEEPFSPPPERKSSLPPPDRIRRLSLSDSSNTKTKIKTNTQPGTPKGRVRSIRPPHTPTKSTSTSTRKSESQVMIKNQRTRRKSDPVSDSELP